MLGINELLQAQVCCIIFCQNVLDLEPCQYYAGKCRPAYSMLLVAQVTQPKYNVSLQARIGEHTIG